MVREIFLSVGDLTALIVARVEKAVCYWFGGHPKATNVRQLP